MKGMKIKQMKMTLLCILLLGVAAGSAYAFFKWQNRPVQALQENEAESQSQTDKKILNLQYGDSLQEVQLFDSKNKEFALSNEPYFIFCVSNTCGSCIEKLPSLSLMEQTGIFDKENVLLVWSDEIPTDKLTQYKLNQFKSVSLNGQSELYGSIPYYFSVEEQKISFATGDVNQFTQYMLENTEYDHQALNQAFQNILGDSRNDGTLVFGEKSCEACGRIDDAYLKKAGIGHYQMITNEQKEGVVNDEIGFLSRLFDIQMYPSALKWTESGPAVEELTVE